MNKILLVTRPNYDDATGYLYYYAELVIKEAQKRGIQTLDLKRPRLTKNILTNVIKDKDPSFIFFNGHGTEKAIYGDKLTGKEEIIIEEADHDILHSQIVYARACSAAASLGKVCNVACFIGYRYPFTFWINERWSTKPANDMTAKLFLEPSNLIVISLLKGNVAEEAVNKSKDMSKRTMLKLLKEKEEPGAIASIMALWNNIESLTIIGNPHATFA